MKINDTVEYKGKTGTLLFIDNPWNNEDGTPVDILCKVKIDEISEFCRLSEIKLAEKQIVKSKIKMKTEIEFPQFLEIEKSLEIKLGNIVSIQRVPKSDKMLKLMVTFGAEEVIVMTNVGDKLKDEQTLKDRQFPFITNLKPVKMMGEYSAAMIMIPSHTDGTLDFSPIPLAGSKLL